ncbi:MAG: hypothetical protein IKU24_02100 [Clostridia bacterium]|nr:hypothetical protein [Clostridia bacterium]
MEKLQKLGITIPETFAVGYHAADISGTPETDPITYHAGTCTGVHDPLMLTCIALSDGKNIALVMTADLKKMFEPIARESVAMIEEKFGISKDHVIISCTHSHSAPDAGGPDPYLGGRGIGYEKWNAQYKAQLLVAVEESLRDLAPVKAAFSGKTIKRGIGFVRRYLLADGTWKMNPSPSMNPVAHESEADPEMRSIRFEREGKKDVLLINFQTHYYSADRKYPGQFSADYIYPLRESAQKEWDCHFAFFYGASANINQLAMLEEDKKIKVPNADEAFMDGARKCREAEEKVEIGELKIQHSEYLANCKVRTPEKVAQAREVNALGCNTPEGKELMQKYGFVDHMDVFFTVYYKSLEPTQYAPFTAVGFGDLAFASAPYEMFHENGKQVRDGSPFKTTFICTLAGASNGYVPSAIGYEHGAYETFNCRFVAGSGEDFANEMIRLLKNCKK